tara:strand:- start:372 stop:560 length:189 start_codon:yes stop_codon:yes gene_type:complete
LREDDESIELDIKDSKEEDQVINIKLKLLNLVKPGQPENILGVCKITVQELLMLRQANLRAK